MVAVNDGIMLRNHISRILKNHFKEKPYYVDLMELFNEVVIFENSLCKALHFISIWLSIDDLGRVSNSLRTDDRFNYHTRRRERSVKVLITSVSEIRFLKRLLPYYSKMHLLGSFSCSHHRIVQYKTAYYSFYLPVSTLRRFM